ncbi:MAG TPA: hypothetical protein VM010_05355 [Chitinophagaceae bacterium]|nr:hypothetical protein [Chitinophagaceae bacterium]
MQKTRWYKADVETKIKYNNADASFRIQKERAGIYTAYLICFEGDDVHTPPEAITLLKGFRNWTGSVDDEVLLAQLGAFIDRQGDQIENNPI